MTNSAARKVLVCKDALLPYSETFIKEQVLAYSDWQPVLVGSHLISGVSLQNLNVRLLHNTRFASSFIAKLYRKLCRELHIAPFGAKKRLEAERAELIHIHFGTNAVEYWPIVRDLSVPIVVTLHGSDINTYKDAWKNEHRSFGARNYPERLLALAAHPRVYFVAVSEAIKQRAVEYGIPSDRIAVRYIGIDVARFSCSGRPLNERARRILFVGRFVEKKGGEFLIEAFARVKWAVPDAELVMVGDGPLQAAYLRLAEQLQVEVKFPGSLPSDEVKRQIDAARVFCLPSITARNGDAEGLPIVILEAQACGVPVVTSARGGATEGVLDGVTGFKFPEKDTTALCDRLIELLQGDELALTMSQRAPQWIAERFDIRRCTQELENFYRDLLASDRKVKHVGA